MEFDNSKPIYLQIIHNIKKKLVRGELKPGEKIQSQREFAKEVNVNPNTVQRAYREMELLGLVHTLRGQGTFITEDSQMLQEIKSEMAVDLIKSFITEMQSLGFEDEQILIQVEKNMQIKE